MMMRPIRPRRIPRQNPSPVRPFSLPIRAPMKPKTGAGQDDYTAPRDDCGAFGMGIPPTDAAAASPLRGSALVDSVPDRWNCRA